ncbi:MAG: ribonuclease III [bacterium]|nr:ribonuclease III [bacterium]
MLPLDSLERKLQFRFRNIGILQQAVTHRSYCNEHRHERAKHNERLEFLGDAVLELVVTEHLFELFPDKEEGYLTELRSALVKGKTASAIAETLDLNEHLRLSQGESRDMKARPQILANALEAIIGALYKDGGYKAARAFVEIFFFPRLDGILASAIRDAKSLLQEAMQEVGVTPRYKLLSESGPDHEKVFVAGVCLGEKVVAEGTGSSKQEAEQNAAANALTLLSNET